MGSMDSLPGLPALSACITRAVQDHIATSTEAGRDLSPLTDLANSVLKIEGYIAGDQGREGEPSHACRRIPLGTIDLSSLLSQINAPAPAPAPDGAADGVVRQNGAATNTAADCTPDEGRTSTDRDGGGSLDAETGSRSRRRNLRPNPRTRYASSTTTSDDEDGANPKRRKATGGLRLARGANRRSEDDESDAAAGNGSSRQLLVNAKNHPQRKKREFNDVRSMQPSTLDKLILGIWEQIHGSIAFDPQIVIDQWRESHAIEGTELITGGEDMTTISALASANREFNRMNIFCRKITQASRCCRALEVIVQARWIDYYEQRVQTLVTDNPDVSLTKNKMAALLEACQDFGWSEKELRNKMSIWKGYHEIKESGGWVSLVFAGMGIYRFCKYRVGFTNDALLRLKSLRSRFEVAADTLHPHWRELLKIIGEPSERKYYGHPHDWVVSDNAEPIPLAATYVQWDPSFSFEHIDNSVIDEDQWGPADPRSLELIPLSDVHFCNVCHERQSDDPKVNACRCFPNLYGGNSGPCPVQVFRTHDGRNNGLLACVPFDRGIAIGEFVGLITRGLRDLDVMQGETVAGSYQIYQGRYGNYTRFINHSCNPNSQFHRFSWLGVQRIILVSKGIEAGQEITVDYSGRYWDNLDKECLCREGCCRYRNRSITSGSSSGGVGQGVVNGMVNGSELT